METVVRACYSTREAVKTALDLYETSRTNAQIDRAIQDAADNIDGGMHRKFYPQDATRSFDWPDFTSAYPWRIWFEQYDLVAATSVTTGGQAIDLDDIFFEPANKEPNEPYTYLELNRASSASFGAGPTPQHDVLITGTWGYTAQTAGAGSLAAAVTDAAATTVTVSDASLIGVGDLLIAGTERMLVQDRAMASTGIEFAGPTTANLADNVLAVPDGTQFAVGEVIQLDTERMLITDISAVGLTLKRAWDGTILAGHTSGNIYASRLLTVARGQYGTTAGMYENGAALGRHVAPPMIRSLNLAEALNAILGETSGYARTVGEGDNARPGPGLGLAGKWAQTFRRYGRKARTAVI